MPTWTIDATATGTTDWIDSDRNMCGLLDKKRVICVAFKRHRHQHMTTNSGGLITAIQQ